MEKFIYYGNLFAIYKSLLNDQSKTIFSLYYEENLTLQEIADDYHVSKSYIGNVIKKCENKLNFLENNLKIHQNKQKLNDLLLIDDLEKLKQQLKELI